MNFRNILFFELIISSTIGAWTFVSYSADRFDTDRIVSQRRIPFQLAQSLNEEEFRKLMNSARRGITPDQMKKIHDAVKRSGILDELKGLGLSSIVLSPLGKKLVILYTNRIAQIYPPKKGRTKLPLAVLMQQLFSLARERSAGEKDPVMENRAAILAASLFANGVDLSLVLGKDAAFAVRPRIQPKQVSLAGRHDLMRHFLTSAGLALTIGPEKANKVGLEKELSDSRVGGSGFSFVDLAANRAGIQLALTSTVFTEEARLIQARMSRIKKDTDIMPFTTGLSEGLSEREFIRRFENTESKSFLLISKAIDDRIDHCSVYWSKSL